MIRAPRTAALLWVALSLGTACGDDDDPQPADAADAGADGSTGYGNARRARILGLTGTPATGEGVYLVDCALCHRADGTGRTGGGTGKDLTEWLRDHDDAAVVDAILDGRPGMPAFGAALADQEVADLAAYLRAAFDD